MREHRRQRTGAVASSSVQLVPGSTAALEVAHDVLTLAVDTQVVEHVTLINVYTPTHQHTLVNLAPFFNTYQNLTGRVW